MKFYSVIITCLFTFSCSARNIANGDNYFWLEDIKGERATAWVDKENEKTLAQFGSTTNFKDIQSSILNTYNSPHKLRRIKYIGDEIMWLNQTKENPKGILHAMTLEESKKENPSWRKLVDFDELSKKESKYLVLATVDCNPFNPKRCMLGLSIDGSDKEEFREFDLSTDSFVKDGFYIPEGIANLEWHNEDSLIYTTTYDEKNLSTSGYSLTTKIIKRGQTLSEAKEVLSVDNGVDVIPSAFLSFGKSYSIIEHWLSNHEEDLYYVKGNKSLKLKTPARMELSGVYKGLLNIVLLQDWEINGKKYKNGDLVGIDLSSVESKDGYKTELIFRPSSNQVLNKVAITKSAINILVLEDVKTKLLALRKEKGSSNWVKKYINNPTSGSVRLWSTSEFNDSPIAFIRGFISPTSIYFIDPVNEKHRLWEKSPEEFSLKGLSHEYYFAEDENGTKIPYQVVGPAKRDPNKRYPTLMYIYGGHGVARTAWYRSDIGIGWLEKGGIFVVANTRGGGEYGSEWHEAAIRSKKHQVIDDMATISKDMFKRGITSSKNLGVYGVSHGGFAACSMMTAYPDLINGAICKAPLTDMLRYTKLFAGKSWISEFGDPEDEKEGAYWKKHSPYEMLDPKVKYPSPLLITWKNDDRVHPGHARRMVAKMEGLNLDAFYYESPEGGHGGGTGAIENARIRALEYEYFKQRLFDTP